MWIKYIFVYRGFPLPHKFCFFSVSYIYHEYSYSCLYSFMAKTVCPSTSTYVTAYAPKPQSCCDICRPFWLPVASETPFILAVNGSLYSWYALIYFNTLRPRKMTDISQTTFSNVFCFNENAWIPIQISLKFVPKGPISNIPALVRIMAWRRPGDKPLSGPMMVRLPTHICVIRPQWVNTLVSKTNGSIFRRNFKCNYQYIVF